MSGSERRLCSALLALFLFGCGCHKQDLLSQGVLVVGLESNPTNLDPRLSTDAASSRIGGLLFRSLFRKDEAGEPVPDLVDRWERSDPTTYRFHLHRGVRFHDGRELDAHDVGYTFRSLMEPSLGSPLRGSFQMVEAIECPDPHTIVFRLRSPFAPFLTSLDVGILPAPEQGGKESAGSGSLIGAGPFRFASWSQHDQIRLVANPQYEGGKPRLREVRFKIVPDDTVRVLELKKGSVHLLQNNIEPVLLRSLEEDQRFRVVKRLGTNYAYLGFNLRDPILRLQEVRQAVAHAIDREAIIENLLGGLAVPATGVLSSLNWAYEPEVRTYPYDPEKARELLDEAGFPDPDGPGPAKRFFLVYKTSQNELRRRIGEAIQSFLGDVGIDVEIRSYEWGTFFSDIRKGNFQIYTLTWVGITDPDIYHYLFHSESTPPNGANRGWYRNAEVDRLLELGRTRLDRQERKRIYSRVQKILAEELPYVSLWNEVNVAVMDRRLRGFVLYPNGELLSLKDAWVEEQEGRTRD